MNAWKKRKPTRRNLNERRMAFSCWVRGLYEVSNKGKVRSLDRIDISGRKRNGMILQAVKVGHAPNKYLAVSLSKDGVARKVRIHRLVANAFIPNPENKPEVNHLNEDKMDNQVENLCWATSKENMNHGTRTERAAKSAKATAERKRAKSVLQIDIDGTVLKEYPSVREAARQTGIERSQIDRCIKKPWYTAKGFHWKYK